MAYHIAQGDREAAWPCMTWADTLGNMRTQDKWRRAMDATAPSYAEPSGKKTQLLPFTTWEQRFSRLFLASVERYRAGHQQSADLVDAKGAQFLASIGHTEQELFDFVEDFAKGGEPTLETALKIATVRRDYFLKVQNGAAALQAISVATLPSKDSTIEGIGWLPRLLPKAEAKLRGEMPPELMYGCGGDRRFFRENRVDPAEFLRHVWTAHGNHAEVVEWVKACRQGAAE